MCACLQMNTCVYVCMYVEAEAEVEYLSSVNFHLFLLKQGLSLNLKLNTPKTNVINLIST